jgi:hypothetical protein
METPSCSAIADSVVCLAVSRPLCPFADDAIELLFSECLVFGLGISGWSRSRWIRSLAALWFIPGVVAFGQAAPSTVRQIGERQRTKINFHCRERDN